MPLCPSCTFLVNKFGQSLLQSPISSRGPQVRPFWNCPDFEVRTCPYQMEQQGATALLVCTDTNEIKWDQMRSNELRLIGVSWSFGNCCTMLQICPACPLSRCDSFVPSTISTFQLLVHLGMGCIGLVRVDNLLLESVFRRSLWCALLATWHSNAMINPDHPQNFDDHHNSQSLTICSLRRILTLLTLVMAVVQGLVVWANSLLVAP